MMLWGVIAFATFALYHALMVDISDLVGKRDLRKKHNGLGMLAGIMAVVCFVLYKLIG